MTISTQAASQIFLGNGVTTSFSFSFIADSTDFVEVVYTDAAGGQTLLTSSQYSITLNPATTGQLWGIGGTVTYPLSGSPIASGTSLTISRVIPLTQNITISNQGDFAPQVIEEMGDTLEMQIQQVSARTGQMRGTWATGIVYNFGDVVQDGSNGANTLNYYMCAIANTSGTWSTDLAAGDWSLVINLQNITNGIPGTASAFVPTGASIPTNGMFLPAANEVGIACNSANVARFTLGGSGGNRIRINAAAVGGVSYIGSDGADTTGQLGIINFGQAAINFYTNFVTLQAKINHTASAVNPIVFTGGTSGNGPTISTSANNADINISPNGTGKLNCSAPFTFTAAASGVVLKRGSNGAYGSFTLTGATPVSVSNTIVATADVISISLGRVIGTVGSQPSVKTITAASGFTVSGTSGDSSVYNYSITKSIV